MNTLIAFAMCCILKNTQPIEMCAGRKLMGLPVKKGIVFAQRTKHIYARVR